MQTFTIDLNVICSNCNQHHAISGTQLCPHCTTLVGDEPPVMPYHPPTRDRVPRKFGSGLAGSLLDLIMRAEKLNDLQFHAMMLSRGLIIEIGIGTEFNLRLARRDSYPSDQEWQTVVSNLPAAYRPETALKPREFKYTARDGSTKWYLDGHWTMRSRR